VFVPWLELGTHHPVIEPISASRRERDFRPQRQRRKCHVFAGGDHVQRLVRIQKAPILARECEKGEQSSSPGVWVVRAPGLEPGTDDLETTTTRPDFWSQYFVMFLARILQKPPCITMATLSRILARPIKLAATPRGSAHTETGSALRAPRTVAEGARPVQRQRNLQGARHRRA
jgi:hypothetical protein